MHPLLQEFRRIGSCISLVLVLAGGCASYDPVRARHEHNESFTHSLARLSAESLTQPLSLEECVQIAMTHNYDVRKAELDRELSRVGRNVAFTAFLPTVSAKAGYTAYSRSPNLMTERRYGSASLEAGMPIFLPSSWFLFAAARQGYAAAGTAAHYVRQGIVLQTSMDYFEVLVLQETVAALETQLAAARENANRITGLAREGFFQPWEADQALFLAESREADLHQSRRQLTVARGALLVGLGLRPDVAFALSGETGEIALPTQTVEELVLQALEQHPSLAMADRQVVIREHQVRQAFADFLPNLSVFATRTWTANDLEDHSSNWLGGLGGAWTLFDGLANTARFKAARIDRSKTELERDATFLNIMIQVIAAEASLRNASETAALRRRAYDVAAGKFADYDAKAREGLLPLGDALDARADMDLAQVELVRAAYLERIALANLELAMGATALPE